MGGWVGVFLQPLVETSGGCGFLLLMKAALCASHVGCGSGVWSVKNGFSV